MEQIRNHPEQDPAEGARDVIDRELNRSGSKSEKNVDGGDHDVEPDSLPNLDALREAAREHQDTYMVKTDLEDADQRSASLGTREQD